MTPSNREQLIPAHEVCSICGSSWVTVYPADEYGDLNAVCECGAHYAEGTGWLDPEDL